MIGMPWAWDKEKIQSPWQELNPWPPEHRSAALSTEPWELMESKVINSPSHFITKLKVTVSRYFAKI